MSSPISGHPRNNEPSSSISEVGQKRKALHPYQTALDKITHDNLLREQQPATDDDPYIPQARIIAPERIFSLIDLVNDPGTQQRLIGLAQEPSEPSPSRPSKKLKKAQRRAARQEKSEKRALRREKESARHATAPDALKISAAAHQILEVKPPSMLGLMPQPVQQGNGSGAGPKGQQPEKEATVIELAATPPLPEPFQGPGFGPSATPINAPYPLARVSEVLSAEESIYFIAMGLFGLTQSIERNSNGSSKEVHLFKDLAFAQINQEIPRLFNTLEGCRFILNKPFETIQSVPFPQPTQLTPAPMLPPFAEPSVAFENAPIPSYLSVSDLSLTAMPPLFPPYQAPQVPLSEDDLAWVDEFIASQK
ncbi:MAG: hypothetical protein K0S07_170 [Chlamydiales bacterium]|jgi:hypothetical protein|nr:hypothetical protein [Chlamydiales bacterium]